MKLIAITTIAMLLFVFGCSKPAPEGESPKLQETVEQTSTDEQTSTAENDAAAALDSANAENQTSQAEANTGSSAETAKKPDTAKFTVYYFTGKARCASCYKIENYTKESVEKNFAKELKAGTMVFKMVDIDEPEFSHFIKDYNLFTKSVVVSKVVGGKETAWKNLEKVWSLLNNQETFMAYIRDEIKAFMEAK
jgi:hypothetical protein